MSWMWFQLMSLAKLTLGMWPQTQPTETPV